MLFSLMNQYKNYKISYDPRLILNNKELKINYSH